MKGLDLLVEAMSIVGPKLGDRLLVVAGSDEVGAQAALERMVDRLGLGDHVRFVGPVHDQDKRDAFAACDFYVLPTLSENFGISVLEDMARRPPKRRCWGNWVM